MMFYFLQNKIIDIDTFFPFLAFGNQCQCTYLLTFFCFYLDIHVLINKLTINPELWI